MKRAWIPLLLAALAAGCGGKSADTAGTETVAAPATPTVPGAPSPTASDCNALGINPARMREGTCTHAGITWVIVDENHSLKLSSLSANVVGMRTARTLTGATGAASANGEFVIVSVAITNRLPARQTFDRAGSQQAGLILDGAVFKEAVAAEDRADAQSCRNPETEIQPGKTRTCEVVFDVTARAAAELGKHGSGDLYLVNFGADLAAGILPQKIGQIRLYH